MTTPSTSDTDKKTDEEWLQNTLAALDAREQDIDYVTRTRLSAARARAVDTQSRFQWFSMRLVVPAVTIMLCTVVLLNLPGPATAPAPAPLMASQDLPILSSGEELEFYQSLELLEWMDDSDSEIGQELQG